MGLAGGGAWLSAVNSSVIVCRSWDNTQMVWEYGSHNFPVSKHGCNYNAHVPNVYYISFFRHDVYKVLCFVLCFFFYRSIVIFCLCFGFSFSIEKNLHFVTSSQWLSIGVISYLVLIASNGPASYLGGLVLTIHLSGLWPQLYCRVAEVEPYKVLPVAIVTYISLIKLGSLELLNFTISEGLFLPAMIVQWYTLRKWVGFGLKVGRIQKPSEGVRTVKKAPSYTMILGQMIRRLSTVAEMEEDLEQDDKDLVKERKSVHQERMRRLLASETEEIRKFDNKRLKKGR